MQKANSKIKLSEITKTKCDIQSSITKKELEDLGLDARFWSTTEPIKIVSVIANVLESPSSFLDFLYLSRITGLSLLEKTTKDLYRLGEINESSYHFAIDQINLIKDVVENKDD